MIARVFVCAAQLSRGENTKAASNPPASCNSLCVSLIAKVQPVRIITEHRCNEFAIEIRSSTNLLHRSGKETIVMRKIRCEYQCLCADGLSYKRDGSLLKFKRDETLTAKISARPFLQ